MIDFSGEVDTPAQKLAMHYAAILKDEIALNMIANKQDVLSKDDAIHISKFFSAMSDLAIDDVYAENEVEGAGDIEFLTMRVMIVIGGYLTKLGYEQIWDKYYNA